jgi:Arc/MetJ-type ribon-helix-helix transcriptional regulator
MFVKPYLTARESRSGFQAVPQKKIAVMIPEDLHRQIKLLIQGKNFSTVDDFVTYTLRISVGKVAEKGEVEDDAIIKERLKALGYL